MRDSTLAVLSPAKRLSSQKVTAESGPVHFNLGPRPAHDILIELHQKSIDGRSKAAEPLAFGFDPIGGPVEDKLVGDRVHQ